MKQIVCFGDSNTWGYDAVTGGRFLEGVRWTGILQQKLGEEYRVIEEGLCGRTAVFEDPLNEGLNGLSYLYPCLMSHSPVDYLVVMLGTNDCKERFSATAKNIADGLRRLLTKAYQTPAWKELPQILLIAPGAILKECETSSVGGEMGQCSEKSVQLIKELEICAKEIGCKFLDPTGLIHMNCIDYMHLDQKSHESLGLQVAKIIMNW